MSDTAPWSGPERRQSDRLRYLVDDLQARVTELEASLHTLSMQMTLMFDVVAQVRRDISRLTPHAPSPTNMHANYPSS